MFPVISISELGDSFLGLLKGITERVRARPIYPCLRRWAFQILPLTFALSYREVVSRAYCHLCFGRTDMLGKLHHAHHHHVWAIQLDGIVVPAEAD